MSTFDEREKGYENKYARDNELEFKAIARRNKYLGQWLAEQMELVGDAADAYALEVVKSDFEEAGDQDLIAKVMKDIQDKNLDITEADVRLKLDELYHVALEHVKDGV